METGVKDWNGLYSGICFVVGTSILFLWFGLTPKSLVVDIHVNSSEHDHKVSLSCNASS